MFIHRANTHTHQATVPTANRPQLSIIIVMSCVVFIYFLLFLIINIVIFNKDNKKHDKIMAMIF